MKKLSLHMLFLIFAMNSYSQTDELTFNVTKRKGITIDPEPVGMVTNADYTFHLSGLPPNASLSFDFEAGRVTISDSNTIKVRVTRKLISLASYEHDDSMVFIRTGIGWYRTRYYCPNLTILASDSSGNAIDSLVRPICVIPVKTKKMPPPPQDKYPNWKARQEMNNQAIKKPD